MNCSNCKETLTCGCQRKNASDGKSVCTKCAAIYERNLKIKKATPNDPSNLTKK